MCCCSGDSTDLLSGQMATKRQAVVSEAFFKDIFVRVPGSKFLSDFIMLSLYST